MRRVLLAAAMLLLAVPSFAQTPATMSYQGVLTDGSGTILPDGNYDLTFRLYNASTGGTLLWTEAHTGVTNHVAVVRGGFSVVLGSLTAITSNFDGPYWLSIQIAADPELSPRTPLTSAPYALGLHLPFVSSATTGVPQIQGYSHSGIGGALEGDVVAAPGIPAWVLQPDINGTGGFFMVTRDNILDAGFMVDGNLGGTGSTAVGIYGTSATVFDMSQTGDASVQLPANSIDANEILDEPGVAQGHYPGSYNVPTGANTTDIVTVTITTPAAGYIFVQGNGQHAFGASPTATTNYADFQIGETANGAIDSGHYGISGYFAVTAGTMTGTHYSLVTVNRMYYKAAGTYTFRLQGTTNQSESLSSYLWDPTITATFFPTSYGTVTASPALAERARFSRVTLTQASSNGPAGTSEPGATVDLRELELRDAQATAAAERAHRQLVEAQATAQLRARPAAAREVKP